jgi:radical SAM enzyme (TIGR01210 family)
VGLFWRSTREFSLKPVNFGTDKILNARGARNFVDPLRPYHFFVEPEFSRRLKLENVATVFLTNRECPFRCLMCDLWKNTTVHTVPPGAIPVQIDYALERLPEARHIKLYNSGNFFDVRAIPAEDRVGIAQRVSGFDTVIVENHPALCGPACEQFQQLCGTQLEIAMGLETSHAPTLAMLNKQMTTEDFARACELLLKSQILIRAFVLLKPPWTSEAESIERTVDSVRFAFDCGVSCCALIPVRGGNGIMEQLMAAGDFSPPRLSSLETVMRETLAWNRGRVFADLWDARRFADQQDLADAQIERLHAMNLTQAIGPLA